MKITKKDIDNAVQMIKDNPRLGEKVKATFMKNSAKPEYSADGQLLNKNKLLNIETALAMSVVAVAIVLVIVGNYV